MDILSEQLKTALQPFRKGVHSKRKEFVPMGSKFLPFRVHRFQMEVTKVVPLVKIAEILLCVPSLPFLDCLSWCTESAGAN